MNSLFNLLIFENKKTKIKLNLVVKNQNIF